MKENNYGKFKVRYSCFSYGGYLSLWINKYYKKIIMKTLAELEREALEFQSVAKETKLKWQKKRNPMTHLKPKKKKRK